MFDNVFVFLSAITDLMKEPIKDNNADPIESRTYSGLLAKFMEGIPKEFSVTGALRDNALNGGTYSTNNILDSGNNTLISRGIFITN